MLLATVYQNNSANDKAKGKFYARPVITETIDLKGLARHMSDHNSPYSMGVITGVMNDMVNCIRELTLEGKAIKIDDLAIFSVGFIPNGGADTAEDFSISKHIAGLKLRSRATGDFSNESLNLLGSIKRVNYVVGSTGNDDPLEEEPDDTNGTDPDNSGSGNDNQGGSSSGGSGTGDDEVEQL